MICMICYSKKMGHTDHYKYLACNMPRCLLVKDILTMAPTSIKRIFIGCANALNTFHKLGAIHRDIKLSNFVHARDGVKLIDFDTVTFLTTDGLVGIQCIFQRIFKRRLQIKHLMFEALGISLLFFASNLTLVRLHWFYRYFKKVRRVFKMTLFICIYYQALIMIMYLSSYLSKRIGRRLLLM